MSLRLLSATIAAITALALMSAPAPAATPTSPFSAPTVSHRKDVRAPKASHVILIGLDGWGAYSLPKADMPNVKALMDQGCWTLAKRSVLPSSSAINWASMFMGAPTEIHGYTQWGSRTPELPSRVTGRNGIFPTIFQICRDEMPSAETACLYEWDGIKYLVDTLSLSHHAMVPPDSIFTSALATMACNYILAKKPALLAVCFDNPDHVGHTDGHDTPAYYAELSRLDAEIGRIIDAIKDAGIYDDTVIILTADHGGTGTGHGGATLAEMETPFIIAGKGIRAGGEFSESMMQYDVASTIAAILGLRQPQVWTGRPMTQVFETEPREHTLMTYNVRNCSGMDGVRDIPRTAAVINAAAPEVVALQELDSVTRRSGATYPLGQLAEATGMIPLYAPAIDYDGGRYGIGILCRERPLSVRRIPLPGREEARTAILAEFPDYFFCSTHLSLTPDDRLASADSLIALAASTAGANKPFFLAGDLNAHPDEPAIARLLTAFTPVSDTTLPTYPADKPDETIDYILMYTPTRAQAAVTPAVKATVKKATVPDAPTQSDHRPVTATLLF